jgi:hypothetical protein
MRLRLWILACIVACGCESVTRPALGEMEGTIVALDGPAPSRGSGTIHVKDIEAEECGVFFSFTASTPIRRRLVDGRTVPASADALTVGRRVEVKVGNVADSCPGQAKAYSIVVLP